MLDTNVHDICSQFTASHADRYRRGEWRAPIFRDLVLSDIHRNRETATVLDIGCGRGFDGCGRIQMAIAKEAARFIGIEPDQEASRPACCTSFYRESLEHAPIAEESIDVAYAVMVLEHIERPEPFWNSIWRLLRPGGVFWGFTVDRRHYFCRTSQLLERIGLKNAYLNVISGERGKNRYENFPVHYRSNTPQDIQRYARRFTRCDCHGWSRPGELRQYYPRFCDPLFRFIDRGVVKRERPTYILVTRAEK